MLNGHVALAILMMLGYVTISFLVGRLILALMLSSVDLTVAAAAPLIGATAFGLQLWFYGAIHLGWNIATLLAPWIIGAIVGRRRVLDMLAADRRSLRTLISDRGIDWFDLTLMVAAILIAATYLLALVTQPVTAWDGIAMWLYKAKLFYAQHAVDLSPIRGSADMPRHLDYPPLFPLMIDTVYVLFGRVDDVVGKGVNFLYLVAAVGTCTTAVTSYAGRRLAIVSAFLLVAMPLFSVALLFSTYMGYADYAVAVCMMISLIFLHRAELRDGVGSVTLAVVFATIAALTKNEGLVFLLIVLVLVALRARPARRRSEWVNRGRLQQLALAAAVLLPLVAWQGYVRSIGVHSDLLAARNWHQLLPALPSRALTIFRFARHTFSFHNDYPWLLASYLFSGIFFVMGRFRAGRDIFLAVTAQGIGYFVVYLLTPLDLTYHLNTSFDRLIIQLGPSLVILFALVAGPHLAATEQPVALEVNRDHGVPIMSHPHAG